MAAAPVAAAVCKPLEGGWSRLLTGGLAITVVYVLVESRRRRDSAEGVTAIASRDFTRFA